jgi:hypothetical protein
MRSLFLSIALMVASLGEMTVTAGKADAVPPHREYRYGTHYYGPYYSNGYWYGTNNWQGGMVWRPRYFRYYNSWPYWGSYSFPQGYYYGYYSGPSSTYNSWR